MISLALAVLQPRACSAALVGGDRLMQQASGRPAPSATVTLPNYAAILLGHRQQPSQHTHAHAVQSSGANMPPGISRRSAHTPYGRLISSSNSIRHQAIRSQSLSQLQPNRTWPLLAAPRGRALKGQPGVLQSDRSAPAPDPSAAAKAARSSLSAESTLGLKEIRALLHLYFHGLLPALRGELGPGRPPLAYVTESVLTAAQRFAEVSGLFAGPEPAAALYLRSDLSTDAGAAEEGTQRQSDIKPGAPALEQLHTAVRAFSNAVCVSSAAARGRAERLTLEGERVLAHVALVRRVVVAVAHGADSLLSSGASISMPESDAAAAVAPGMDGRQGGQHSTTHARTVLADRVRSTGRQLLSLVVAASRCADQAKSGGVEVLHISKSGGTSMCELARLAGMKNPEFNPVYNCKISGLDLMPRWLAAYPPSVPPMCSNRGGHWLVAKVGHSCSDWSFEAAVILPEHVWCIVTYSSSYAFASTHTRAPHPVMH